ncbi:MAG TPA: hypothetical protein VII06_29940 [Chloroflexota bacterium]|jgi:hypothetical protein
MSVVRLPRTISRHAVERWQERVEPGASALGARLALRALLDAGRVRPTPRHWTRVTPEPGLCFVYAADQPGVCALVRDRVVVTVLTRALCRASRRPTPDVLPMPVWGCWQRPSLCLERWDGDAAAS